MKQIKINDTDRQWLENGVIGELIQKYGLTKKAAHDLFKDSDLLSMLEEMPEYIFHYDTQYWAKQLIQRT